MHSIHNSLAITLNVTWTNPLEAASRSYKRSAVASHLATVQMDGNHAVCAKTNCPLLSLKHICQQPSNFKQTKGDNRYCILSDQLLVSLRNAEDEIGSCCSLDKVWLHQLKSRTISAASFIIVAWSCRFILPVKYVKSV